MPATISAPGQNASFARQAVAPSRPPLEPLADLRARLDLLGVVAGHVALKRRGQHEHWGRCPFHREKSPSFKVDTARGTFHCFGCGAHGDVLDFLAAIEGLDGIGAIKRARELVGGTVEHRAPPPRPAAAMPDREAEARRELAQETWRQTMTIWPGTEPWRYLREVRGIGRWDADRVRWHPACPFGARKAGCIVVPVGDHATGLVTGVWRILPALTGKVQRMGLGPMKGNAARLCWAPGPLLAVAEGVEDALAYGILSGVPTWAALTAGNMAELILPARFREVHVVADADATGRQHAARLVRRLRAEGRTAQMIEPVGLKDANAVLLAGMPTRHVGRRTAA